MAIDTYEEKKGDFCEKRSPNWFCWKAIANYKETQGEQN